MTQKEREELIKFIIANDTYNYKAVNFNYYSDEDLLTLKEKIEMRNQDKIKPQGVDDAIQSSDTQ